METPSYDPGSDFPGFANRKIRKMALANGNQTI
jgi:hypothetical protein